MTHAHLAKISILASRPRGSIQVIASACNCFNPASTQVSVLGASSDRRRSQFCPYRESQSPSCRFSDRFLQHLSVLCLPRHRNLLRSAALLPDDNGKSRCKNVNRCRPDLHSHLPPTTYLLPSTTYHIPSLVSRAKTPHSQEQECRGGRDPALRDAGGYVMKMIEAAKMPQPRHEKIPPRPQAESACRRHHKEAVKK